MRQRVQFLHMPADQGLARRDHMHAPVHGNASQPIAQRRITRRLQQRVSADVQQPRGVIGDQLRRNI